MSGSACSLPDRLHRRAEHGCLSCLSYLLPEEYPKSARGACGLSGAAGRRGTTPIRESPPLVSCGISAADPVPPYGWTAAAGALAARARAVLDAADLPDVRIVASGGLDEYAVDELVRTGAPIDVYAVGTRVGVSADGPVPGLRLQDGEYDGRPVMKLSSAKVRAPGPKQVFRGSAPSSARGSTRAGRGSTPTWPSCRRRPPPHPGSGRATGHGL